MNESSSRRFGLTFLATIGLVAAGSIGLLITRMGSREDEAPERIVRRKPGTAAPAPAPNSPFAPDDQTRLRSTEKLPEPGEYVYIDELPEAITKVPPAYPEAAMRAGIHGTVVVQALVGKDGRVIDSKIVQSLPELDAAAESAVRQWKFKPAKSYGKPVAVWVAVPVKFTLL